MSLPNICAPWSKSKSGIGTEARVHTGPAILLEVGPGGKQIQLQDPDGNPVELFEPAR
jgi:hypothetical protein